MANGRELLMANRTATMVGGKSLPYDAEVEYLQSSGTQYIETPITLDGNSEVDIKFFTLSRMASFGSRNSWLNSAYTYLYNANTNDNYMCYGSKYTVRNGTYLDPLRLTCLIYGNAIYPTLYEGNNPIMTAVYGIEEFTTPYRCVLFGYFDGSYVYKTISKIYHFKSSNRTESVEMIPVRVGSGDSAVGYMYDRVSGKLFGNAGTGAFEIGPDKT